MTYVTLSQPPQMSCIGAIGMILGDWHDTGAGTREKVAAELDGGFPRSNDNNSTEKFNFHSDQKLKIRRAKSNGSIFK